MSRPLTAGHVQHAFSGVLLHLPHVQFFTRVFVSLHALFAERWRQSNLQLILGLPGGLRPPAFAKFMLRVSRGGRIVELCTTYMGTRRNQAGVSVQLLAGDLVLIFGLPACPQTLTDHPVLDLAAVASRKNAVCTAGSEGPGPQLPAIKAASASQPGGRCYQDLLLCGTPHTGKPVFKEAYLAGRHVQSYYKKDVATARASLPQELQQSALGVMKVEELAGPALELSGSPERGGGGGGVPGSATRIHWGSGWFMEYMGGGICPLLALRTSPHRSSL
jgi:hypothetical protein